VAAHTPRRSRTRQLAERRPSLVRLLIALFVARIAVTVTEVAESQVTWWSALITLAIGLEAWRAWSVRRDARRAGGPAPAPPPLPDTVWDRMLRPVERLAPPALYGLGAIYLVVWAGLAIAGEPRDTLLDIAVIAREVITFFFLFVILAAYRSLRDVAPSAPAAPAP
jgi:hypothetical protein